MKRKRRQQKKPEIGIAETNLGHYTSWAANKSPPQHIQEDITNAQLSC